VNRLRDRLGRLQRSIQRDVGIRDKTRRDLKAECVKLGMTSRDQVIHRKAALFIERVAEQSRIEMSDSFEAIVGFVLQSVLGPDYGFKILYEQKRDRASVKFHVVDPEYPEGADPLESRGGGVVDLLSFALRMAVLELSTPRNNLPIILDEPFKHVHKKYSADLAEMLKRLSDRTGRQFIVVTHNSEFAECADERFEISGKGVID